MNEKDFQNNNSLNIPWEDIEMKLNSEVAIQLEELRELENIHIEIGSVDTLRKTLQDTIWEQFMNQIGGNAGEKFIAKNEGKHLDLRNSAHIQTVENFKKGKLATHNPYIDFKARYESREQKFAREASGEIKTHHNLRINKTRNNITREARAIFDAGRPVGSSIRGTDMDHTISVAEIIRDDEAATFMSEKAQVAFANSDTNLKEMNSSHNRSKKDLRMTEWLDNPNSNGQKPNEIFDDLTPEKEKEYRENAENAEKAFSHEKEKGKKEVLETGRKSQREEAKRIGKSTVKAVLMALLAELARVIINNLIVWFKSVKRDLNTFLTSIKEAISKFVTDLKNNLLRSAKVATMTIITSIFGPIVSIFTKLFTFLNLGIKSIKQSLRYLKDPSNKSKPFSIKMAELSKIAVGALSGGGALILGEVIEKGLMNIPAFAFPIPLLGNLANIIGLFMGALISGIIGAIILNFIDRWIANKKRELNIEEQINVSNKILATQNQLNAIETIRLERAKEGISTSIEIRHKKTEDIIRSSVNDITRNNNIAQSTAINNKNKLTELFADLDKL